MGNLEQNNGDLCIATNQVFTFKRAYSTGQICLEARNTADKMLSHAMIRRHEDTRQPTPTPIAKSRRGCIRNMPGWWGGLHPNASEMITKEPTETAEPQLARFNEGGDPTKCILDTVQGGYRAKVHGKTQAYTMERPWAKLDEFGTKKLAPKRAVTLPVPYDCGEDQRLVYKGTTNLRLKQRLGNIIKTRAKSAPLHGSPQPSVQSSVQGECSPSEIKVCSWGARSQLHDGRGRI